MKHQPTNLPTERLSIISALIILNYALMPFIYSPQIPINFSIAGFIVDLHVEYADLMVLSASLFAAIGTYWLLYDHPMIQRKKIALHLILPTVIAGALSIPLNVIEIGLAWWVMFGVGSFLIIFTLIAEYYSVDPDTSLFALARIFLIPLSISLLLLTSIATRSAGFRLYIQVLVLGIVFATIFTRLVAFMEISQNRKMMLISTLLFVHFIIACHYLPLTSISFGLLLTGFSTFLISFPFTMNNEKSLLTSVRDAAAYTLPFFASAFFFL
ncbi:MAG TPA: hypothetical protein DCK95_03555 [Anaerolineaceae bacterium]|nr:hypothetical protein [Anaerolineaceae bacterium]